MLRRSGGRHPSAFDHVEDGEVLERILAGESELYSVLVRRYQERLYRHALGMVMDRDTAADLVQDAFVRAYAGLARCRDPQRFGTWLFQILRNRCLDHLKERRRKDTSLHDHPEAHPVDDPAYLERWALRDVLQRALAGLSDTLREAFILRHVHDLSYEEMARVTGASESALRMRVLRAREQLRAAVGDSVSPPGRRM